MNDRELLELAAKAAGFEPVCMAADGCLIIKHDGGGPESCLSFDWNPLTDDGDALRLAVKLKLWTHSGMGCFPDDIDGYEATRSAIVRAAAEIGRSMQ